MKIRDNKLRRKNRSRYKLKSVANFNDRLRLYFYITNNYLYSQVINDKTGVTITSFSTYSNEFSEDSSRKNISAAKKFGSSVAQKLLEAQIKDVYFDRGGKKYHGKVKAFAESAREFGLNF